MWMPNEQNYTNAYNPYHYSIYLSENQRDHKHDKYQITGSFTDCSTVCSGVQQRKRQNSVLLAFRHDDVIKWKHFPRHWPFVRGIHRSPVNSPHKGQWRGALMFSLICLWINGWVNNREAGDLRHHRVHYDVAVVVRGPTVGFPLQWASNAECVFRWWRLHVKDGQVIPSLQDTCNQNS